MPSKTALRVRSFPGPGYTAVYDIATGMDPPNPVKAIEDAVSRRKYDGIILSTLPSGISRWLGQDLPHKVTRKFKGPVTVVTASRSH